MNSNLRSTTGLSADQQQELQRTGATCSTICCVAPLGSIWGIRIKLSIAYPVFWAIYGWIAQWYSNRMTALFVFISFGPVLLTTLLLHELGHAVTAKRFGGEATEIVFWPLGGIALIDHNLGPKVDFWISIAGPLTHLPQLCFWVLQALVVSAALDCSLEALYTWGECICSDWALLWVRTIRFGIVINILLFCVNLIPVFPMDGGRALLDAYLCCGMTPRRAATLCVATSIPLTLIIGVLFAIFLHEWLSFAIFMLFLLPNAGMIWLICKDKLEMHPSFRNLKIHKTDVDRTLLEDFNSSAPTDAEVQL